MARTPTKMVKVLRNMRDLILQSLKEHGAYLFYDAASGSQYIKFKDPRVGSLRIADHKGKERYSYKWNLIHGGKTRTEYYGEQGRKCREFYSFGDVARMVCDIDAHAAILVAKFGHYNAETDPYKDQRITHVSQIKKPTRR